MITSILTEGQEELRRAQCELLEEMVRVLEGLGAGSERGRVSEGLEGLDRLFRIGVAGGDGVAVDGVVAALMPEPVERLSVVVAPAAEPARWEGGVDVGLFVTSASHPLPPGDHALLVAASDGAGALFVVVDGVEMLRLSEDVLRMEEAVAIAAERVLGFRPHGAGVSTSLASSSPAPKESLVPALAGRIVGVLRSPAVVRPKLLAPLETAQEIAEARRAGVAEGLAALAGDLANLEALETELGRFDREAEAALREAETAADEAVAALGERAGAFVRRRTRPFPLLLGRRRLAGRFRREVEAPFDDRLREMAAALDGRLARAAEAGRASVVERLASFPTPLARRHASEDAGPPGGGTHSRGVSGPAESALAELRPRPQSDRLLGSLHWSGTCSLVLLGLGLLLVLGAALGVLTLGAALPRPVLAAGLGAVAVLATAAVLGLTRQQLTALLAAELDDLRAAAAAALAAGAERSAAEGRSALRAPAAAYGPAVAGERDRLTAAGEALERLTGALAGLRSRIERA